VWQILDVDFWEKDVSTDTLFGDAWKSSQVAINDQKNTESQAYQ
jgi:hypothetical protein